MTATQWNESFPEGTRVRYFPTRGDDGKLCGEPLNTITRSPAWSLGCGVPVVKICGRAGGVSLEHLEVLMFEAERKADDDLARME